MSINNSLNALILSTMHNPQVQKILPTFRSEELLETIYRYLNMNTGQLFLKVTNISNKSPGLVVEDRKIRLSDDWGVKLSFGSHPSYIDTPSTIRFYGDQVLLANNNPTGSILGSVFDKNLNFVGPVGLKGTTYNAGEQRIVTDMALDVSNGKYYLVSELDHIVQVYNKTNMAYAYSLGTGVAGVDGTTITDPVSVGIGVNGIYVLCKSGSPAGSTGPGFLATYSAEDGTFKSIPLYKGKNGGTGRCTQGEIVSPKDIAVITKGGIDYIYILNSTDEIGVFRADDWSLVDVYNIPSNVGASNLGLSRICFKDEILYITASNIGQVLAIDIKKKLVGSFGTLRSEALSDAPGTLGYFNGLSGITAFDDKILVAESLNNRIQVFGKALLADSNLNIIFEPVHLSVDKKLVDISYSLTGDVVSDIVLIDPSNQSEYDIKTAIARNLNYFSVKMKIDPSLFSLKKSTFDIYPVYILMEG